LSPHIKGTQTNDKGKSENYTFKMIHNIFRVYLFVILLLLSSSPSNGYLLLVPLLGIFLLLILLSLFRGYYHYLTEPDIPPLLLHCTLVLPIVYYCPYWLSTACLVLD